MVLTRFLQKKQTKKVIYIQVVITAEAFLMCENTSEGFDPLPDQTQTEEEHVDCSCAGLLQLSS